MVNANGYFDNEKARYQNKKVLNKQRTIDYQNQNHQRAGGVVDPLPEDAPFYIKDYQNYLKI